MEPIKKQIFFLNYKKLSEELKSFLLTKGFIEIAGKAPDPSKEVNFEMIYENMENNDFESLYTCVLNEMKQSKHLTATLMLSDIVKEVSFIGKTKGKYSKDESRYVGGCPHPVLSIPHVQFEKRGTIAPTPSRYVISISLDVQKSSAYALSFVQSISFPVSYESVYKKDITHIRFDSVFSEEEEALEAYTLLEGLLSRLHKFTGGLELIKRVKSDYVGAKAKQSRLVVQLKKNDQ